ncbi:hypothetical protein HF086_015326 [Spodoptera exigua]|uniref:Uncharacterized protein n=1 Tax=Spodoptera exigua TaxID=7107 RepID=A0A922M038_SPOEX|nr:hypothetical protein HF086_015326 [Spodoptera exigua]
MGDLTEAHNRTKNFTFVRLTPIFESEEAKRNRTINGAISTLLITKLLNSGWPISNEPSNDDSSSEEEGIIHIVL